MKQFKDKFVIENFDYSGKNWKKIAIFFKKNFWSGFLHTENLKKIAKYNKINLFIIDALDDNIFWQNTYRMNQEEFENYYNQNKDIYEWNYSYLKSFIESNNIDLVLFCANLIPYKPQFLEGLRGITKIASWVLDDDVENVANRISKPYVKYYD